MADRTEHICSLYATAHIRNSMSKLAIECDQSFDQQHTPTGCCFISVIC